MGKFNQPSMAKGEVAADVYGRVDVNFYSSALAQALNFIIHPHGGASNRPGTLYLANCKEHTYAPRLIKFQEKTTDSYQLEFGNLYMRVVRNDALVLESSKAVTGITSANPGVVTVVGHGWSTGNEVYLTGMVGMDELVGGNFKITVLSADTFSIQDQVTGANVDTTSFAPYGSGGTAARVYEITTPYVTADLDDLSFVQNANLMTLTHQNYPVYELTRSGHTAWTLAQATFGPAITYPLGETVTVTGAAATTHWYRVTAHQRDTLDESLPGLNNSSVAITAATAANPAVFTSAAHPLLDGDEVQIDSIAGAGAWTALNTRRFNVANKAVNTFQLLDETGNLVDSTAFGAYPGSGITRQTFVRVTNSNAVANNKIAWSAVTGAEKYSVYKFDNGSFGFIGETAALSFTDDNIAANLSHSHPRKRNPFISAGNYPGCASYYEQRRVLAGTKNAPDTAWYSQTGRSNNLNISTPLQEDDAITATLNSLEVNEIRHMAPDDDLLLFTSGSEWKANSGPDAAFSAESIKQREQSRWGISRIRPLHIGNATLYVTESKAAIRSIGYSFQDDKYTGNRLDILCPHLFKNYQIRDWCFSLSPDPRIYGTRADGFAFTLTYDSEQQVNAFTQWQTQGSFERASSMRNPASSPSPEWGTYFVIKRRINGNTVRYIEKLASRNFNSIQDAHFVDCGLVFNNPLTVESVTTTSPLVIRITGHGLVNGDTIDISDIVWDADIDEDYNEVQPDQLNGYRYTVANRTADTFQLLDGDGVTVAGGEFNAYVEGGFVRKAVQNFSGFRHLEGRRINVLGNGSVTRDVLVTNGAFSLDTKVSRLHAGLGYKADLQTLGLESQQGTIQGALKHISNIAVRVQSSNDFLIGPGTDSLRPVLMRELENMGEPNRLTTDVKRVDVLPKWDIHGQVFIRQADPVPLTVLSITPEAEVGG